MSRLARSVPLWSPLTSCSSETSSSMVQSLQPTTASMISFLFMAHYTWWTEEDSNFHFRLVWRRPLGWYEQPIPIRRSIQNKVEGREGFEPPFPSTGRRPPNLNDLPKIQYQLRFFRLLVCRSSALASVGPDLECRRESGQATRLNGRERGSLTPVIRSCLRGVLALDDLPWWSERDSNPLKARAEKDLHLHLRHSRRYPRGSPFF